MESGAGVRLGGKYEILPTHSLEELRSPNAPAFVAVNRERAAEQLFALVCAPDLPPRKEVIEALFALRLEGVVTPLAWGVVEWPASGRRHFALIFDRPAAGKLLRAQGETAAPLSEDEILGNVLPPVIATLKALFSAGITHRGIRADNLFRHAGARQILLGECVSAPPAALQPLAYESIEGGMALPVGRGNGAPSDDLYALGATLIVLALGQDPTAQIPPEQLLRNKIDHGSYAALAGGARVPTRLIEALRGLLRDDARERWTIHDLELWFEGRRLPSKQFAAPARATRMFEFGGNGYHMARPLAHAFAHDPANAARIIRGPDFPIWLQRSLAEAEHTDAVAAAVAESTDAGAGQELRLTARTCIALDPSAPIRYGDFAAAIDGFGPALAAAFCGKGSVQTIGQALAARLPQFWFSTQVSLRAEQSALMKTFERMRHLLDDRRPGFGIERIAYELNPGLHCLSPHIERDLVVDAGDVLRALERAASAGRVEALSIDRHLAAFIAVRCRPVGNDWCEQLGHGEPRRRALGTLQLLARLQAHRGPPSVPALCAHLAQNLPPLIERFHNRPRRDRLKSELGGLASRGSLVALLELLDNSMEQRDDAQGFAAAQREYAEIKRALAVLQVGAGARPAHAAEVGGRFSVTSANALAWVFALAAALLRS